MIKVLNLYSGIGGNRKLWPSDEIEVTAVEINPDIAKIYQDFFPSDRMIIGDAHQYLLDHYKEYDFIWSSPPCPTHSRFNQLNVLMNETVKYPDMGLYQEIILLQSWFKGKYCIENVISYYEPLIKPQISNNHFFWCNFYINKIKNKKRAIRNRDSESIKERQKILNISLDGYSITNTFKKKLLNNCTEPKLGLYIFNAAFKNVQLDLLS